MSLIDFILNLAGLLLWFNWRAARFDPLVRSRPATLTGTLRRAEPARFRRWHLLLVLAALILVRATVYSQLGPAVNWQAQLELGVIAVSFRTDFFWRTLLFSFFSFCVALILFYLWLILLSLIQTVNNDEQPLQKLLRLHLGRVDGWPGAVKVFVPLFAVATLWWLVSWPLSAWGIVPRPASELLRAEQALLIGGGSYLAWKYLIVGLLTLYLVNSYVYFGNHAFWNQINASARQLLAPLQWIPLRLGKVDFAPVLGSVLVLLLARLLEVGLTVLYLKLPA